MAPTHLIVASASAVIVPVLAAPLVTKIPGGAIGFIVVGAAIVFAGSKWLDGGMAGAVVVGAGAGLIATGILSFFPTVTVGGKKVSA